MTSASWKWFDFIKLLLNNIKQRLYNAHFFPSFPNCAACEASSVGMVRSDLKYTVLCSPNTTYESNLSHKLNARASYLNLSTTAFIHCQYFADYIWYSFSCAIHIVGLQHIALTNKDDDKQVSFTLRRCVCCRFSDTLAMFRMNLLLHLFFFSSPSVKIFLLFWGNHTTIQHMECILS